MFNNQNLHTIHTLSGQSPTKQVASVIYPQMYREDPQPEFLRQASAPARSASAEHNGAMFC
jgi:hypothetical protein